MSFLNCFPIISYVFIINSIIAYSNSQGYEAYAGGDRIASSPPEDSFNSSNETKFAKENATQSLSNTDSVKAPLILIEPPRLAVNEYADSDIIDNSNIKNNGAPSLGYRPPPPPLKREVESLGKCKFGKKNKLF